MWATIFKGTLFILLVGEISSSSLTRVRKLETPYNMSIGHVSPTSIMARWNFTKPDDVALEEMLFKLQILNGGLIIVDSFTRFTKHPLQQVVSGLKGGTNYTLALYAECDKCERSKALRESFDTLEEDWATPVVKETYQSSMGSAVNFTVTWTLGGNTDNLHHVNVEFCTPSCRTIRRFSNETFVSARLRFYINFTFQVTAVYDVPVIGFVYRPSALMTAHTDIGKPGRVRGPIMIELAGDDLRILWPDIDIQNGPLIGYEVLLVDVMNPLLKYRDTTPIEMARFHNSTVGFKKGHLYEIFIRGVNKLPGRRLLKGDYSLFKFRYIIPPKPKRLDFIERGMNRVRFRVLHAESTGRNLYQVETDSRYNILNREKGEIEVVDLLPNQEVFLGVRECFTTVANNTWFCGPYGSFRIRSNVGAPSPVANFAIAAVRYSDCIEASWSKPERSRGPIHGYILYLSPTLSLNQVEEKFYIPSPTRRKFIICESYFGEFAHNVGIAAFNVDLVNRSHLHVGDPVYRLTFPVKRSEYRLLFDVLHATCVVSMFVFIFTVLAFLVVFNDNLEDLVHIDRWLRQAPRNPQPENRESHEAND